MRPIEVFRDVGSFSGLDGTDKMPFDAGVIDRLDFFQSFIDVVFAEARLASVDRFLNRSDGFSLADREEFDGVRVTSVGGRMLPDFVLDYT